MKRKSLGGRMRERERQLTDETAAQRRARRAARDVYGAVGFDLMYADGTCQVEEGVFSQTVAFADVSYQSARDEAQKAVFSGWCSLFDYFPPDSCVQLTVVNRPVPAEEIGAREFFRVGGRGSELGDVPCGAWHQTAQEELAREYNRILNDKMREGVSNLVRERYLTFSVMAGSVDAAAPKLARMRADAMQTLSRIRSEARMLSGEERLGAINSLLRPGKPLSFSWDAVGAASGLTSKDFVCPMSLDFKPEGSGSCYRSEETWCEVLVLHRFGSELDDRCLADIIDLPIPLSVSLHVQAIDKAAAVAFVKQRIAWMDKEVIDEQMSAVKKGYDFQILPSELKYSKEEAEDLLDHLVNRNQRLFRYTGLVMTYAGTRAELDERVDQIAAAARLHGIEADSLDFRQREAMNSVLPLGMNHVEVSRLMTTAQVAIQMPFATQELAQAGGGYYGQNKQSSNLVLCNRKALASPMGFVAGKPGSGKSFSVKREIQNTILAYPDDEVIVLDPAGEYSPVVEGNGGECIRFAPDAGTHLNPFDLADVAHQSRATQMAFKVDAFLALSAATMAEGSQGLPESDKSIIARCVEIAYERARGRDGGLGGDGGDATGAPGGAPGAPGAPGGAPGALGAPGGAPGALGAPGAPCGAWHQVAHVPVLGDFYEVLLEQPEGEAREIALRYERYVKGAMSFFNHPSNVAFGKRVTNVDFREVGENMRAFALVAVLECVRNRMYYNFERGVTTWLYIDEVQSLFGHPAVISYFSKFWAEGRKFGLIATGISQNSVYMLAHEEARTMVLNSDFILLHKQSPVDRRAWAELLDFSAQEEAAIDESAKAGEGILIAGGARIAIKDDFPRGKLYDLFNTKASEVAEAKRAAEFAARAATREGAGS